MVMVSSPTTHVVKTTTFDHIWRVNVSKYCIESDCLGLGPQAEPRNF